MDLLGGYGSSGSESDSDSDGGGPQLPHQPAPSAAPAPKIAAAAAAAPSVAATAPGISKRGRRLLSLNAVLPPEIFDRLTRSSGGGVGAEGTNLDSSSDEDEDDNGAAGAGGEGAGRDKTKSVADGKVGSSASGGGGGSGVMGDFLAELRSAPKAEGSKKSTSKKGNGAPVVQKEEKLGQAFMTVSTTVTSRKDVGVADIHASTAAASAAAAANNNNSSVTQAPEAQPKPEPQPQQPQPAPAVPSQHQPLNLPSRRAAPSVSVPRPGLSAAPRVGVPVDGAAPPQYQQQYYQNQYRQQQQQQHEPQQQQQQPHISAQQSRKKSRRDLERSLRAGNFDALGDDARTSTLHQTDGSEYIPTEADLSEAAARTAAAAAAKRGAAGLRMYDPSAGADVDVGGDVSQKHRSKHQINQLVAQAAVLEAHRASVRTVKGSSSRADAKRKYGF